jgi:peptide/nickel transport system permease protein
VRKYLQKKILIYILTFFVAVSLDWAIPRLMPGDPVSRMMSRFNLLGDALAQVTSYFNNTLGLDRPVWEQYLNFWREFLHGNLGMSIQLYPKTVMEAIRNAMIYDIILLLPTIGVSFFVGNKLGALSAVNKRVDAFIMPIFYTLTSTPYFWLALLLSWILGVILGIFPISGAYSLTILPNWSLSFVLDYLHHWVLPFLSLFIVAVGGWAIGMRNMIIYELGSNYSKYMESLGSSPRLIRRYAYRNGILPQVTGLAIQIGLVVGGALTTEVVFAYPGIGYTLFQAILNQDYFLIQGCFIFIVIGVLIANFLVDIVYMMVDPRVRHSYASEV